MIDWIKSKGAEIAKILKKAKIIGIIWACGIVLLFLIHGLLFVTKIASTQYGSAGSCAYTYNSFGLGTKQAQEVAILKSLSSAVMSVVYSPSVDGNTGGVLSGYRNALLNSYQFQVIRIMLVVMVVTFIGIGYAFGFTSLRASDILKRLLIIGVFLWATNSSTYEFYDRVLEPLVIKGTENLSSILNGAVLSTIEIPEFEVYKLSHPDNEFVVLDAMITMMFSEAVFNKIGGLIFMEDTGYGVDGILFVAISVIIYMMGVVLVFKFILFVFSIIFYKLVIVIGLSLFPIFMLFFAMKAVGGSLDKFSTFFKSYGEQMLIRPSISIVLLTFAASIVTLFLFSLFVGAFSFQACMARIYIGEGFLFFLGNYDYFSAIRPYNISEMNGTIVAINKYNIADYKGWSSGIFILAMMLPNLLVMLLLTFLFKDMLAMITSIVNKLNIASAFKSGGFSKELNYIESKAGEKFTQIAEFAHNAGKSKSTSPNPDNMSENTNSERNLPVDSEEKNPSKRKDPTKDSTPLNEKDEPDVDKDDKDEDISEKEEKKPIEEKEEKPIPDQEGEKAREMPEVSSNSTPLPTMPEPKTDSKLDDIIQGSMPQIAPPENINPPVIPTKPPKKIKKITTLQKIEEEEETSPKEILNTPAPSIQIPISDAPPPKPEIVLDVVYFDGTKEDLKARRARGEYSDVNFKKVHVIYNNEKFVLIKGERDEKDIIHFEHGEIINKEEALLMLARNIQYNANNGFSRRFERFDSNAVLEAYDRYQNDKTEENKRHFDEVIEANSHFATILKPTPVEVKPAEPSVEPLKHDVNQPLGGTGVNWNTGSEVESPISHSLDNPLSATETLQEDKKAKQEKEQQNAEEVLKKLEKRSDLAREVEKLKKQMELMWQIENMGNTRKTDDEENNNKKK